MSEKLKQDHFKVTPKKEDPENPTYLTGRGAQINTKNRFLKNETTREHIEGIDDWEESNVPTIYMEQESKTIVNKVESKDVGMG
ncbi:MAG: radical SAM protein, partial [Chitinophagaceae bacterium]